MPLDPDAFAEFGDIIHHGSSGRHYVPGAFDTAAGAAPRLWVNSLRATRASDIVLSELERHPHSSQSFIPLGSACCLAVVARDGADGRPDPDQVRAFVVAPGRGVCYRRGTWHHGFISLDQPSEVAVIMALTDRPDDTEVRPLPAPVRVRVTESGATDG